MIRLFVINPLRAGDMISLSEKQVHYLFHVMRLRVGNEIAVFNGRDGEWVAQIEMLSKKGCTVRLEKQTRMQTETAGCILCPALIKKEPMDFVLQKAVELGASAIYPVITERTVVRNFNMERARMILQEAAEQSERLDCPVLHEPVALVDLPNTLPAGTTLVYLAERTPESEQLSRTIKPAFLIGPEGGFSPAENVFLNHLPGVCTVHLGQTILRAETAALAILSCWAFEPFTGE